MAGIHPNSISLYDAPELAGVSLVMVHDVTQRTGSVSPTGLYVGLRSRDSISADAISAFKTWSHLRYDYECRTRLLQIAIDAETSC